MTDSWIEFEPRIPLPLWVALAVAAIALLIAYASLARRRLPRGRRIWIVALMVIVVGLPMALLLNPTWVERIPPPAGKPRLTVLVDATASMAIADSDADADSDGNTADSSTRYAAACEIAERAEQQLGGQFDVQVRAFTNAGSPQTAATLRDQKPHGDLTNVAGSLAEVLDDRPEGHAVLLVSDGVDNANAGAWALRNVADQARAFGTPIYTRTIGGQPDIRDVAVDVESPQELAFVEQQVPVTVHVRQRGLRGKIKLSLLMDENVVQRREVELSASGLVTEQFTISQKNTGLYRYQVVVEPVAGEITDANNRTVVMLRVVDQPIRVLLLEGKPYWDTKFLVRTLATDASIELVSAVRLAEGRILRRRILRSRPRTQQSPGPADAKQETDREVEVAADANSNLETWSIVTSADELLSDSESLKPYQIVVLGRDADVFLNENTIAALKKWLADKDGSLVCYRGPPAAQIGQRLASLMPVQWTPARESRFRVDVTEVGRSTQWLPSAATGQNLRDLPSLAAVAQPEVSMPLSVVLATGMPGDETGRPAISYRPVGIGRVVVVEGAGMWRWAFLPPKHQQHDTVYGTLWRSLVRWLVAQVSLLPSQQMALRPDKITFGENESAAATLMLRKTTEDSAPVVELTGGSLEQARQINTVPIADTLGQYRIPIGSLPAGQYRLSTKAGGAPGTKAVAMFEVRGNLAERLDAAARPDIMNMLARESGGRVLQDDNVAQVGDWFGEHLAVMRPDRTVRHHAWDRWWVLLGVMGLWAATWSLRRMSGLI